MTLLRGNDEVRGMTFLSGDDGFQA